MLEKLEAYKHLSAAQKRDLKNYASDLFEKLESIEDLNPEEKQEYFNTMVEYQTNYYAAKHLKEQYNSIADKMEKLNEQYKNEPNDEKAKEILETYNKYKKRSVTTLNQYNKFKEKRQTLEKEAIEKNELVNEKLAQQEKGKELTSKKDNATIKKI